MFVTGGGWEEEVVRRIIAYKTIGFIASVYVCLDSTELHPAASSPFSLHPQCSNGLFCLNADYCLCFRSIRSSAEHSHSTSSVAQIPYWSNAVIRSQAVLAGNESQ